MAKLAVTQDDEIKVDGQVRSKTPILARLLRTLLQADRKVVASPKLMATAWGIQIDAASALVESSGTLRVHMHKLRRALGRDGKRVVTVRGQGYKLVR